MEKGFGRMEYTALYTSLKDAYDSAHETISLRGIPHRLTNLPFHSHNCFILPGEQEYRCTSHYSSFVEAAKDGGSSSGLSRILHREDSRIRENCAFSYALFSNGPAPRSQSVIVLFHGLNERSWEKYLPWAYTLLERTGKSVILFPLAFHMNRAPAEWSEPRPMRLISQERRRLFPAVGESSFANAAISTRLHALPQRFFWSGMQTYYDFLQLLGEIRDGRHPLISRDAGFDFFGYSIGAFLSEIIFMIDPGGELNESKLFIFCGGPTFDRMSPVSKYILDSQASLALYSFFVENFEGELKRNPRLAHYFSDKHPEGYYFRSMLSYHKMRDFRESRLHAIADRVFALALERDTVIYPDEVINTLKGRGGGIPIRTRIVEFPYTYIHENPFPALPGCEDVDRCFDDVFSCAADFLR
jgi:hypothetical protein